MTLSKTLKPQTTFKQSISILNSLNLVSNCTTTPVVVIVNCTATPDVVLLTIEKLLFVNFFTGVFRLDEHPTASHKNRISWGAELVTDIRFSDLSRSFYEALFEFWLSLPIHPSDRNALQASGWQQGNPFYTAGKKKACLQEGCEGGKGQSWRPMQVYHRKIVFHLWSFIRLSFFLCVRHHRYSNIFSCGRFRHLLIFESSQEPDWNGQQFKG